MANRLFLIFFLLLIGPFQLVAQDSPTGKNKAAPDTKDLHNEITAGVNLNTNGGLIGGVTVQYAVQKTSKDFLTFNFEAVNVKNFREMRWTSTLTGSFYIPRKVNYLFSLRPSLGWKRILFSKYPEDGVRLSAHFAGGISIGILKPYYIDYREGNTVQIVAYDPEIHSLSQIAGSGGFFNGFDQMKVRPGINLRAALDLELGKFESNLSGIEAGAEFEAFASRMPIYATGDKDPFFFASVFVVMYFGNRL